MRARMSPAEVKTYAWTLWKTVWAADLWVSFAFGLLAYWLWVTQSGFKAEFEYSWAIMTTSLAIAAWTYQMHRNQVDLVKSEVLGEFIRKFDPDGHRLHLPYQVATVVAVVTTFWTIVSWVFIEGIESRPVQAGPVAENAFQTELTL